MWAIQCHLVSGSLLFDSFKTAQVQLHRAAQMFCCIKSEWESSTDRKYITPLCNRNHKHFLLRAFIYNTDPYRRGHIQFPDF